MKYFLSLAIALMSSITMAQISSAPYLQVNPLTTDVNIERFSIESSTAILSHDVSIPAFEWQARMGEKCEAQMETAVAYNRVIKGNRVRRLSGIEVAGYSGSWNDVTLKFSNLDLTPAFQIKCSFSEYDRYDGRSLSIVAEALASVMTFDIGITNPDYVEEVK